MVSLLRGLICTVFNAVDQGFKIEEEAMVENNIDPNLKYLIEDELNINFNLEDLEYI